MDRERLGDCLAVFDVKRGVLISGILFALFNGCLGAFIIAGALIVPVNARANPLVQGLFMTPGAFLLMGSAYLLFLMIRHIGLRVSQHPGGLAILRGQRIFVLPWHEIDVVWHKRAANLTFQDYIGSILDGSQSRYTLQGPGGERVILDSFLKGHETLGEAIRRETTRRLLPHALHAYEVEGHVEFGKLAVSREGLSKGGKILPWSDIACVVVDSGSLLVRRRNGRLAWFAVPMGRVPNLYVYLALVENILVSLVEPSPN